MKGLDCKDLLYSEDIGGAMELVMGRFYNDPNLVTILVGKPKTGIVLKQITFDQFDRTSHEVGMILTAFKGEFCVEGLENPTVSKIVEAAEVILGVLGNSLLTHLCAYLSLHEHEN